jgi:cytochrome oxidase assembly protein ShyY1
VLPEPPPSDDVNHLEYAFQWFAFALIPLVGWPIVLWRISRKPTPSP